MTCVMAWLVLFCLSGPADVPWWQDTPEVVYRLTPPGWTVLR